MATVPCRAATTIYSTGFEAGEGYTTNADLVGRQGWQGDGSGGNGIVSGFFPGQGQQAYIGYTPPTGTDQWLFVWHPLSGLDPVPAATPIVTFSVLMDIENSSNTNWDDFYWSVYNAQGSALFTLDFDNYNLEVNYSLDGTNLFRSTGITFSNSVPYTLAIRMDFSQGRWTATFNGMPLTTNSQPMTTVGAPLNLGDVDAAWIPYDPAAPGNNYMVFDNYRITAEGLGPPAPRLEVVKPFNPNAVWLRLFGQENTAFAIDASTNLTDWVALKTNTVTGGYFDYVDAGASALSKRFYRGRWVP